jgi:hypothetical protein
MQEPDDVKPSTIGAFDYRERALLTLAFVDLVFWFRCSDDGIKAS